MKYDVAIIGAGIAGAGLAAALAPERRVILIEREPQPGYHATGRSAAFWSETYGGPGVQPLTSASREFLADPPGDFAERGFLGTRGAFHIAGSARGRAALARLRKTFETSDIELIAMDRTALAGRIEGLKPGWDAGVYEPSCADIDVARLHHAYLLAGRRAGATLVCDAEVGAIDRDASGWQIATAAGAFHAAVVVNAAGAWADEIAGLAGMEPLDISAYRRTIVQLRTDPEPPEDLPLVIDAEERFYFKGESGGRLWLSPHDETAEPAGDTAPVEIDIATAIDRFERAVDWHVVGVERKWAGQRSFAPDRLPVYGFDPGDERFFWCAGQGGFGIQTAPAAAALCRALLLGMPEEIPAGVDGSIYAPSRFCCG